LQTAAAEAGVADAVTFTGWVAHETLHQAVVGAKVGLSPVPENYVLRTNSPTKVLEYLNLATPAVATPTPEQKRVLRESEAGRLASRTVDEFCEAIVQLLSNESRRRQLGREGRKYITSNRSYNHAVSTVREVYESL
jgi:glycosyltransferase involved in cell wall biosynthesis